MNRRTERLYNDIMKENPTFVLMFGVCPTLAIVASAINGLGMGFSTTVILLFPNIIVFALRKIIPDRVRIPVYIVVIAFLVTMVQLLLQAYVPSLYLVLDICVPLIMINCVILSRTESYASKNGPVVSIFDGLSMGLGFTLTLTCIGLIREILGSDAIFGDVVVPEDYHIAIFMLAPGAFFVLTILTALQNKFKTPSATNGSLLQSKLAYGGSCMPYTGSACMVNHEVLETRIHQAKEKALAARKTTVTKKKVELKLTIPKKGN